MASLISYGLCQTACNAGVCACYAAAGLTFGAVTGGVGAPAAAIACNGAQGVCMSACAAKFLAEGAAETAATGGILGPVVAVGGTALAAGAWFGLGGAAAGGAATATAAGATGAAAAGGAATAAAAGTAAATGTAATSVAFGAGRMLLMGTGAIGIGLTCTYVAYMLLKSGKGRNAAPQTAIAHTMQEDTAVKAPMPEKTCVPKLDDPCASFPLGIRVAHRDKEGSVVSIENGLIAVDFGGTNSKVLCPLEELEVVCNDASMKPNSSNKLSRAVDDFM